jgi:hypothetical protein
MRKEILPLIALVLLSGPLAAQQVLYENPLGPQGTSTACTSYEACAVGIQVGQSFTLTGNDTVQAVSFIASDNSAYPLRYTWSIYSEGPNGLPTGLLGPTPTGPAQVLPVIPVVSSPAGEQIDFGTGPNTYSSLNLVPGTSEYGSWLNEVTINTGSINLGAGSYIFALTGFGSSLTPEGWDAGINGGGVISNYDVWSSLDPQEGLAMTVIGTPAAAAAPEIDPSSAMAGLTLLCGGLLVLRGCRPDWWIRAG